MNRLLNLMNSDNLKIIHFMVLKFQNNDFPFSTFEIDVAKATIPS